MLNGYPPQSSNKETVITLDRAGFYYLKERKLFRNLKFWALRNVTFDLYQGETLGVMGRNGAGKSTLLKLLAGIYKPDEGIVSNNGYTCTLLSLQSGFVPNLSGRDNVYLAGLTMGMKLDFIKKNIEEIKEFSGLEDFFEEPVFSYSSGMSARLGFSIALQLDPDILLIDEVLGAGDKEFRQKSTARMKEKIWSNKTIVLVSHQEKIVEELCDRAIKLEQGSIVNQ